MKADVANPFDLTGRVAVVTDGGSPTGIGMATASLLAGLRAAQRVVDAAVHRWGRLDILVNNTGTTSVSGPGDRVEGGRPGACLSGAPAVPGPSALRLRAVRGRLAAQSR